MSSSIVKSLILQQDQSDCGVACLATIIRYHEGESSLEKLRRLSGTSLQGTTLLGVCQAAQQSGFDAEGLEAESVDNLQELNNPAILHVVINGYLQHYLVFYGFEKDKTGKIIMGDPAKGIVYYTKEELKEIWDSKTLLKLTPNQSFIKKEKAQSNKKKWIVDLIKEDYSLLLLALFLGLVIAALGLSTAIFSQKLIDDILPKANTTKLIISLVLVTVLLLARGGIAYLRGFFMIRQSMDFNNRIIERFYSNLLHLPKYFFDTRKTGELIARMNDTRRIQTVISSITGNLLIDFLLVIVSLTFVIVYSWTVGCVILLSIPLFFILAWFFNPLIISAQKEVMAGYAMTESHYVDSIQGINAIKTNQREFFFNSLNKTIYGVFQKKIFSLGRLSIKFSLMIEIMSTITIMIVFGLSSWQVLHEDLLIGEMVAVLGMAGNALPSITRLAVANIQLQEARVAFERMYEFTGIAPEEDKVNQDEDLHRLPLFEEDLHLEVKDVSFRFPGRPSILKNVSLSVNSGELIVLLGESGSGKSTFLQLLQKFYSPETGSIKVNTILWDQIKTSEWRAQTAVVPQDIKIFNGNLLYNITMSDLPAEYERAMTFCRENGFNKFFSAFPQGYFTLLGEEGINISGGQKQIVALARALYKKPKLLLLDEATSAMDRITENFVINLLMNLKNQMGILLITHRIKTAQKADRIYILEKGVVTSSGSPSELMVTDNFFSESYRELVS